MVACDDHVQVRTSSSAGDAEVSSTGVIEPCAACGAPLADDQRYCLECGERRFPMSSVLLGGPPSGLSQQTAVMAATPLGSAPPPHGPATPPLGSSAAGAGRSNTIALIAGVGVLLLAMGVGVLIGRSGASKPSPAPAQVISVTQPGATGTTTTPTTPETSSKPGSSSSKNGSKKGASSSSESKSGVGASESHPAPPTILKNLSKKKGKNYEQESKNLPNVISTG